MIVLVNNAILATNIFIAIFILAILISAKKRKTGDIFPLSLSQELKGFAILAVVFSHVGYFLVSDTKFLYPLTTMAGVAVNIFLFLSGFGLVVSSLKKEQTLGQFYLKNLTKLFVPLWLTLIIFFSLDYFFLHLNYGLVYVINAFLGFFSKANLYTDVNSPLWYFTLILFYYVLFPLVFFKKRPWLSAIIIYLVSYFIVKAEPNFLINILGMYKVHLLAFPLGMVFASSLPAINKINILEKIDKNIKKVFYFLSCLFLLVFIGYTAVYHSGVGASARVEEITSLITMAAVIILFAIKKIEFKFLSFFGIFSFEVYLLHWPVMYRYDFLFKYLPAWLAMFLYLFIFLGLAKAMQVLVQKIIKFIKI